MEKIDKITGSIFLLILGILLILSEFYEINLSWRIGIGSFLILASVNYFFGNK